MEIRVEEHLTGKAYRDRILLEHGSLDALRKAAKRGSTEAKSDLADLELLEEDPRRLLLDFKVSTVSTLEPSELERLTPQRLKLLAKLSQLPLPAKMGTLTAKLRRDKKNVSRDIQVLRHMGLVEAHRQGRETLVQPMGTEIHISLAA